MRSFLAISLLFLFALAVLAENDQFMATNRSLEVLPGNGSQVEEHVEEHETRDNAEGGEGGEVRKRKKVRKFKITRTTYVDADEPEKLEQDKLEQNKLEQNQTEQMSGNGTDETNSGNETMGNETHPIRTVPDWDEQRAPTICGAKNWHFYDGFCYKLIIGQFTWAEALAECKNETNATLVSIQSRQENEFVASLSAKFDRNFDNFCDGIWIGMTRTLVDKETDTFKCEWVDGTNVTFGDVPKRGSSTAIPWRDGQPDNTRNNADGSEGCVEMYPKMGCDSRPSSFYAQWNDFHCSAKLNGAVCKKRQAIKI